METGQKHMHVIHETPLCSTAGCMSVPAALGDVVQQCCRGVRKGKRGLGVQAAIPI